MSGAGAGGLAQLTHSQRPRQPEQNNPLADRTARAGLSCTMCAGTCARTKRRCACRTLLQAPVVGAGPRHTQEPQHSAPEARKVVASTLPQESCDGQTPAAFPDTQP